MAGLDIDHPITLTKAFTGRFVIPGDTLILRGGIYSSQWLNKVVGTSDARITVKPYNNELVIIRGDFNDAQCKFVTYIDIEFDAIRNPISAGVPNVDPIVYPSHTFAGEGVQLINCTIHDGVGAGFWDMCDLFYGSIAYSEGVLVLEPRQGSGHSLYCQNDNNPNRKTIKHSIFGRSANYGLHGYATNFPLKRFDIIENVLLPNNAHLIGSQKADDDITFVNNHSFGTLAIGYGAHDHTNLTMTGNYLANLSTPFQYHRYVTGTVQNNIYVGYTTGNNLDIISTHQPELSPSVLDMDNNIYYNQSGKTRCFSDDQAQPLPWKSLQEWRTAYGFDLHSTIYLDGTLPNDSVYIYPNEYAPVSKRKGLVVIWNWTQVSSVNVDLTNVEINVGDSFTIINSQDPKNDIITAIMPANKIVSIPMTGHTVIQVDAQWGITPSTFPRFGCFILEKV